MKSIAINISTSSDLQNQGFIYDKTTNIYTLTYPNQETRLSFNNYLLSMLANTTVATITTGCQGLIFEQI